jgi:pyruvate dehydrogenase E2 component (dihydrolipoamide acetyltransferase)
MSDFLMPSLGADMESAKVTEWLVQPGGRVKRGDVIVIVETHKGAIEVEIFQDGVISELCAKEGETVPVGGLLAHIATTGEAPGPIAAPMVPKPEKPAITTPPPVVAPVPAPVAVPAPPSPLPPSVVQAPAEGAPAVSPRAKVTPAARRRAAEIGIDPAALRGTGIDGSVTLADVEVGRGAAPAAKPAAEVRKARAGFDAQEMRKAIAAAMGRSKREIPHYYLSSTVDLDRALAWLSKFNQDREPSERLLPAILLLKAAALALREVPQLNGFWVEGGFRPGPGIHVGWAISLRGGGLVAPAIRDADQQTIPDLMSALRDVVGRARGGGLRSSELTDATVTVTSLGERGADSVIGIIYPPQVAIVGFGRIAERPWVADGRVKKRPLVSVSLAGDHRASDGHHGGLLLSAIDRLLQEPEKL